MTGFCHAVCNCRSDRSCALRNADHSSYRNRKIQLSETICVIPKRCYKVISSALPSGIHHCKSDLRYPTR